jgi:tetratricopeptide (TPR) repeat protein
VEQGNYSEALKNHFAALKVWEETGDKNGIALSYYNLGSIYKSKGNYPEALKNYFTSLKIREEIGDKYGITNSYLNIGYTKVKMKSANEGKDWLLKGLNFAKEIGVKDNIRDFYESLALADSALGNFKGAYENHKLFILYRDSLNNEVATKKMLETKMQYEFDKKEAETKVLTDAELKKQKLLRNGFVGGFAVVLLFAGVFFHQRNKTKKEKKRSEDLLLNILPVDIAEEIKTTGTAKAKAYTMATVMFTDFKDFTTVSEKISAELLVDEIHHCFSVFDNILNTVCL